MGVGEGLAANQSGSPPAILPRSPDSRVRLGYIGIPRDPAHASNCSPSGSYDRDSSVQTQFGKSGCPSRGKSRRITEAETESEAGLPPTAQPEAAGHPRPARTG